jgi:cytoskeletal protein CcmA (bactofilin family)
VAGNLTVTGNLTYLNVDNIVIQDPLFYVAEGNQFDFLDIGIVGNYTKNSFNQHGGIVRDASDSIWKFFANVEAEPTTTVDFGSATYDSILAGNVMATGNVVVGANITLNGRLFAGGSAGNGSDILISTGSGVSWTALDKSSLEFDTSSLVLDNVWGNLILNNTSSVSFAGADSTSIFHSNVEVNKNLTVDGNLSVAGNVNAVSGYFLGNGSQLTGLPSSYGNTQVASYLPIYSGVLGSSNLQVTGGGTFSGTLTVNGGISGTISTTASSQPNITSTGTLTNLQTTSLGVGTAASGTTGEIRATNNITAYFSSDRTLKENIQDIPNALDKVLAIGGKTFDWTDDYIKSHGGSDDYFLRKEDFGVIAQDVQSVFPLAVRQRPDGTLAVDYEKMCALAFAAINELRAEIDKLRASHGNNS